jgi:hypothetical protein
MPHYCWGYNFDWQGRHGLTPVFNAVNRQTGQQPPRGKRAKKKPG